MGSDVGQFLPTGSLHGDHLISYTLVCEKELSHMGKNNGNPDLVCENFCLLLLPLWESVIVLCFVVCYFMSILVLLSS